MHLDANVWLFGRCFKTDAIPASLKNARHGKHIDLSADLQAAARAEI